MDVIRFYKHSELEVFAMCSHEGLLACVQRSAGREARAREVDRQQYGAF